MENIKVVSMIPSLVIEEEIIKLLDECDATLRQVLRSCKQYGISDDYIDHARMIENHIAQVIELCEKEMGE
jgi:hypothetical protein